MGSVSKPALFQKGDNAAYSIDNHVVDKWDTIQSNGIHRPHVLTIWDRAAVLPNGPT